MEKIDPSLVDNPLIFPTEDYLADTFGFMAVDTKTRETFDKEFNQVIGA
jgi:spermidine/putrescine transport system substrate-binding protein